MVISSQFLSKGRMKIRAIENFNVLSLNKCLTPAHNQEEEASKSVGLRYFFTRSIDLCYMVLSLSFHLTKEEAEDKIIFKSHKLAIMICLLALTVPIDACTHCQMNIASLINRSQ